MGSATDLELGQLEGAHAAPPARKRAGFGGSGGSVLPAREAQPVVSKAETLDEGTSSSACGCIPSGVFRPITSMRGGSNIERSQRNISDQPTQMGQGPSQAEAQIPVASDPTFDPGARNTTSGPECEEPRMIGDFDCSANEFWKLYIGEAKSHDDARINTLKEGMKSALIFAGLFSAALTAFVVDSKQNLKPSPADETVYYLRQHSAILSQISLQLSSIAPQVAIPSAPPPPFPSFTPLASDVRVNVFWFMALVFSLLAALLAILVQQWVRNYMHLFRRYGDPLKSSRVGSICTKDAKDGLGESLLNINTKVAISTIVPIGISGLLYIFTIFAPIIYPQSPYQNSFSGILWYLIQTSRGRRFRDQGGEVKSVSTYMAQGRMQLAMEETAARKGRDVTATRWLIDNLTEDAEMEKFLSAIPGSFNTDWGTEVWKMVDKHDESEDQSILRRIIHPVRKPAPRHPPTRATTLSPVPNSPNIHPHPTTTHNQWENVVRLLSLRVARSVEICKNRGLFANNDLWRKRTRACIEATASLVCCANAKFAWFGDISKLLGDIGSFEKIRELSLAGTDELFVKRWTCLSLVAIRQILADSRGVQIRAGEAIWRFAEEDDTGKNDALSTAEKINKTVQRASDCLFRLRDALGNTEDLTEEVIEILRGHESQISELEQINIEAARLELVDKMISSMPGYVHIISHQIISQFPGVLNDFDFDYHAPIPFSHLVDLIRDPRKLPFTCPGQTLKSMCSPSQTLRNILEGKGDADAYKELLKNLNEFRPWSPWQGYDMRQQLWCLQDLRDGGGLGFSVELFFLALSQLLPTSSSKESHSALYTGTFRAITSDWIKHKDSLGTQNLLLYIVLSRRDEFGEEYPAYIVDEFLLLLGKILEGQTSIHIDSVRQWFEQVDFDDPRGFRERVLGILTGAQAQSPGS